MEDAAMTIGRLASRLGINPRTIRYYERIELIPEPDRTVGGYRLYDTNDEDRLRFIKSAQRIGLTLGEIKETLAFRERGEPPCDYIASVIEQRLTEVNQRLGELRLFKRELTELRDRILAEGPTLQRSSDYCHYIQTAGGSRPDSNGRARSGRSGDKPHASSASRLDQRLQG